MMEPYISNDNGQQPERYELHSWQLRMPDLSAGFSGRHGGVSKAPYDSLNLALHVNDDPEAVLQNRSLLAESLGFEAESWTCGQQVHGNRVAVVRADDRGKGYRDLAGALQDCDGLVTNVPGILLTSFYADCVPLYFIDPVKRAVALAHAGWKGTVLRIAEAVIGTMKSEFGSAVNDIHAAIGPSIGECCYEVDDVVMARVRETLGEIGASGLITDVAHTSQNEGKFMLNLKELNRIIMIKAGILPTHIECTSWCTSCHHDKFFSYRKDQGITGRMASWIGMKER